MYEVIKAFCDSKNDNHLYMVGDVYPVEGYKPTKARIEELVKGKNKFGVAFLKDVPEDPKKEDVPEDPKKEDVPEDKAPTEDESKG